jgi:uncharacterized protein (DUF2164 family)
MREQPPIELTADARAKALASVKRFFEENLDEPIGELKARLVLDYIITEHGPAIYNQAISDARKYFEERSADLGAVAVREEFPFWDERKGRLGKR